MFICACLSACVNDRFAKIDRDRRLIISLKSSLHLHLQFTIVNHVTCLDVEQRIKLTWGDFKYLSYLRELVKMHSAYLFSCLTKFVFYRGRKGQPGQWWDKYGAHKRRVMSAKRLKGDNNSPSQRQCVSRVNRDKYFNMDTNILC